MDVIMCDNEQTHVNNYMRLPIHPESTVPGTAYFFPTNK